VVVVVVVVVVGGVVVGVGGGVVVVVVVVLASGPFPTSLDASYNKINNKGSRLTPSLSLPPPPPPPPPSFPPLSVISFGVVSPRTLHYDHQPRPYYSTLSSGSMNNAVYH